MLLKQVAIMFLATALLTPYLRSEEEDAKPANLPERLLRLRESWQAARKRALDPIDRKYQEALKDMMDGYTRAGDLEAALAVKSEIDRLKPDEDEETDGPAEELTILRATFGSAEQREAGKAWDRTAVVRTHIKDGKVHMNVTRELFGDPNPFGPKTLVVEYIKKGSKNVRTKEVANDLLLELP